MSSPVFDLDKEWKFNRRGSIFNIVKSCQFLVQQDMKPLGKKPALSFLTTLNKMDIYGALRSPASSDNITHYSLMICLCWVARRACVLCAGWHRPVDILMWRHPGAPVVSSPPDSHHVSPQDSRHRIRHARWVHCDRRKKSSLVLD